MIYTPRVVGMMVILLCLASGCRAGKPATAVETPGQQWLSMNHSERNLAVREFAEGYETAGIKACSLLSGEFEARSPELLEELSRSNVTASELCEARTGRFSRGEGGPQSEHRFDTYSTLVTSYYETYPDHQYVSLSGLLEHMVDGADLTLTALYRDTK